MKALGVVEGLLWWCGVVVPSLPLLVQPAASHDSDHHHDHEHDDERCAVGQLSVVELARDQAKMKRFLRQYEAGRRLQGLTCDQLCDGCITIDT